MTADIILDILNPEKTCVGRAKIMGRFVRHNNLEVPFYLLHDFFVDRGYRGQGYGTKLLEKVNQAVLDSGRFAVAINGISPFNPAGRNFYERHGWRKVFGEDDAGGYYWISFNIDNASALSSAIAGLDND